VPESNPLSTQEQRAAASRKVFFHRHRFTTQLKTLRVEMQPESESNGTLVVLSGSQNFSPVGTICRHFFSEVYNIRSEHLTKENGERRLVPFQASVHRLFIFYIWAMGAFVFL